MAQMLALVVNERQDDWDLRLPHIEFAYNNSGSAATGLAPNEVHMGILPRLPLTVFERTGVTRHRSLACDHLAFSDLVTDRQQRRTLLCANTMPSPFPALTAESPLSPTRCVRHPNSSWVVGHG